ncbi:hypothetical protein BC826DRAFT_1106250 [Russula brevipes]|nr:hypothetical protein BC826DRAFT_1106250 [Russula brevipes]
MPSCWSQTATEDSDEYFDKEADGAGIEIEIIKESCPCDGEIEVPARPQSWTSSASGHDVPAYLPAKRGQWRRGHLAKAPSAVGGAAVLLGLIGTVQLGRPAGREGRRELSRLARGGMEMQEPGVFAELLAQTDSDGGGVVREIDKDAGRAMPLNMFFGGDGVGVQKLRRVPIVYSRHNSAVGYCQGMGLVASTLLLVHADEQEAFWVLASARPAHPPGREGRPKLATLGIDRPAICFFWFLSFTDCLPVEELMLVALEHGQRDAEPDVEAHQGRPRFHKIQD